ncbi:hypothetical protein [Streptomyces sp. HPF1205]|uniref:hypothetical protein n=1 Tax=Streptomyces sp. HPF1205 TaxID=2873262 RepID=UPI0021F0E5BD|nr:hypothetical protein [Streptomyces sp. HPF1205]
MSRETDSSSSGPQGRGGAAYPSGTPPYGTRSFPSLHPQEEQPAPGTPGSPEAAPEGGDGPPAGEPRTETTLTTRIRINIPGSRPIPPVVVRTPVEEPSPAAAAPAGDDPTGRTPLPQRPVAEAAPEPEKKEPSDWFAPRKPVTPAPGQTPPGDPEFGAGADAGGADFGTGIGGSDFGSGTGTGTGVGGDFGATPGAGPDPIAAAFAAGPASPPPAPAAPAGPGADDPTGAFPAFAPPPQAPADEAARGPHDTPAEGFASPFTGTGGGPGLHAPDITFGTQDFPPGVPRPTDPFAPPQDPGQDLAQDAGRDPGRSGDSGTGEHFLPPPAGPTAGPATGDMRMPTRQAAPDFAEPAGDFRQPPEFPPPEERISGDTLVSGIPAVPSGEGRGPRPTVPVPGPAAAPAPDPVPAAKASAPGRPESAPARKKGRSKLVLLAAAAGAVVVLAYGAGLLMNHAEVPKGTTVLGVDIGDKTKAQAVKTLDDALGNRTTAPLTLTVGGRKESLKPSVAGLSIDTDATVRKAAHSDYNPVSVIGSLFGGSRKADPVILVDQDKLKVALQGIAGRGSTGSDAMVRFEDGKAIGVPGKPGTSFDVGDAADRVAAAYRTRAATGVNRTVALDVRTVPPKVSQATLDEAVNGFGRTAMSGFVTVRAGGHVIRFGPTKSLPKFLTMLATPDGKLAPHIDLDALKSLCNGTFDHVMLARGNGTTTPVTMQDVATAIIPALNSTKPADRDVTLPNVAP